MTKPNDLWDDMSILNSLYGELCWDNDDPIEFIPDYENDQIMRSYLQCSFFARFKRIIVNTVHCAFSDVGWQLSGRKAMKSVQSRSLEQCRSKYFLVPEVMA